jgi:hypothetical protein
MKKILLSSAAIVAFAGAASADISWGGDASLGYNDDVEDGIYWDLGLTVGFDQELNNGWTASASLDVDISDNGVGTLSGLDFAASDWALELANETTSLSFGDVDTAVASFDFVTNVDNSTPEDAADGYEYGDDGISYADAGILLTGEFGVVDFAASALVLEDSGDTGAFSAFIGAEVGTVELGLLFAEEETFTSADGLETATQAKTILASLATTYAGVDFTVNAGEVAGNTVYGLGAGYAFGDFSVAASYAVDKNADEQEAYYIYADYQVDAITVEAFYEDEYGEEGYGLEASYDLGTGLVIGAGYIGGTNEGGDQATYIVSEYDLGGGASVLASYADAEEEAADDIDTGIGGYELMDGFTLELSLDF